MLNVITRFWNSSCSVHFCLFDVQSTSWQLWGLEKQQDKYMCITFTYWLYKTQAHVTAHVRWDESWLETFFFFCPRPCLIILTYCILKAIEIFKLRLFWSSQNHKLAYIFCNLSYYRFTCVLLITVVGPYFLVRAEKSTSLILNSVITAL